MSLKLLARKLRAELAKRQSQAQSHKAECIVLHIDDPTPEGTPDTTLVIRTTHKPESYTRLRLE